MIVWRAMESEEGMRKAANGMKANVACDRKGGWEG